MPLLGDIFNTQYGNSLPLNAQPITDWNDKNGICFVSRGSKNNGVVAKIMPLYDISPFPAGTISVAASGSVLESFLQPFPFYSGHDIFVLSPQRPLSDSEKLYYCQCIRTNAFRYNYGRQANRTLRDITLPAPDKIPAWAKSSAIFNTTMAHINDARQPASASAIHLPHTDQWQWFYLRDLFQITGSQTTSLDDLTAFGTGPWPYITTQSDNNGVEGYYNYFTESGGVIVVDSAVLGFASYQAKNFSASDHVEKLIPQMPMSKYAAIFITALLNKQQFRYNYGRKCSQVRLTRQQIKLPADKDGKPNFVLMENYIKSLPFSAAI